MTAAVVFIPLTQGKVTVIDFDDFEKVRGHKWYANKSSSGGFYAVRGNRKKIYLHSEITECPPGMEVNHKDGDGLDNRQENFKICTHQQNMFGFQRKRENASSQYRGVDWRKQHNSWRARIRHNGKSVHLGLFDSEEAAALAYDTAAAKFFGEFASLNLLTT